MSQFWCRWWPARLGQIAEAFGAGGRRCLGRGFLTFSDL